MSFDSDSAYVEVSPTVDALIPADVPAVDASEVAVVDWMYYWWHYSPIDARRRVATAARRSGRQAP